MTEAEPTDDSQDVGRRYRFEHLALPTVLRDMKAALAAIAGPITA
ncbi:hypothetical protein LCGC14_2785640, partial [marine sediment metagenome]